MTPVAHDGLSHTLLTFCLPREALGRAYVDMLEERKKAAVKMTATLFISRYYRGMDGSRARLRYSSLMYMKYTVRLALPHFHPSCATGIKNQTSMITGRYRETPDP